MKINNPRTLHTTTCNSPVVCLQTGSTNKNDCEKNYQKLSTDINNTQLLIT